VDQSRSRIIAPIVPPSRNTALSRVNELSASIDLFPEARLT
jgi:hypothetical protein